MLIPKDTPLTNVTNDKVARLIDQPSKDAPSVSLLELAAKWCSDCGEKVCRFAKEFKEVASSGRKSMTKFEKESIYAPTLLTSTLIGGAIAGALSFGILMIFGVPVGAGIGHLIGIVRVSASRVDNTPSQISN